MSQLTKLKSLVQPSTVSDDIFQFLLDTSSDIICEIRNSNEVENKYLNIQLKMAIELYNKLGAEGQIQHFENGISRVYENGDVSRSLLNQIQPMIRTPFSITRVVNI